MPEAAPYVGRRRVAADKPVKPPKALKPAKALKPPKPLKLAKAARPARGVSLAGATVPATAAAALSLVATGVGVAAGVDGAAVAQSQTTEPDGSAALAIATARDISTSPQDVTAVIAERRELALQEASRGANRAQLAQSALLATQAAHRWVLPVAHYVKTSGFGIRWGKLHAGEDFAAPIGTPVHAISSGVIVFAGVESGYGNKIEIRHWDGTCSWYGHLSKIDVKVGQKVDPGELIGLIGSTGHSTGPHLHLEIHPHGDGPVDPLPWLRAHGLKP